MKTLESSRLILRAWRMTDAEDMYEYAQDPRVGPEAGWPPHANIEATRDYLKKTIEADDTWALELKDDGKVIGAVGLHLQKDRKLPCREIGYVMNPKYWGHGYMSEAAMRAMEFAFTETDTQLILCKHRPINHRSRRVIEKCCFCYDGIERAVTQNPDGTPSDLLSYSVTRDYWQKHRGRAMEPSYRFFQDSRCEYFPCHKTSRPEDFSCRFCYCPLYHLGRDCGGNFVMLDNGIKDCSNCLIPHYDYDRIIQRLCLENAK